MRSPGVLREKGPLEAVVREDLLIKEPLCRALIFILFHLLAHKLITKILRHTKKYVFCQSDKKIGIILIHSHWMVIVVLAVVFFIFDSAKGKEVRAVD